MGGWTLSSLESGVCRSMSIGTTLILQMSFWIHITRLQLSRRWSICSLHLAATLMRRNSQDTTTSLTINRRYLYYFSSSLSYQYQRCSWWSPKFWREGLDRSMVRMFMFSKSRLPMKLAKMERASYAMKSWNRSKPFSKERARVTSISRSEISSSTNWLKRLNLFLEQFLIPHPTCVSGLFHWLIRSLHQYSWNKYWERPLRSKGQWAVWLSSSSSSYFSLSLSES